MKNSIFDKKELTQLLGVKYPIIQGSMACISDSSFVLEVMKTGALATLSSYGLSAEELREEILFIKSKTKENFACNLMLQNPNIEELLEVLIELEVPIVTVSAGYNPQVISKLKDHKIKILAVVSNLKQALKMQSLGVDGIISEGMESGGHIGQLTTLTLMQELTEKIQIPLIAAGGISSRKAIDSLEKFGISGIQVGTLFLVSKESPLTDKEKPTLLEASSLDAQIVVSSNGLAMRGVREESGKIIPCGQAVGQISELLTLKEIVENLINFNK